MEQASDWQETTHPEQGKAGHREFENIKTGEKIRFDAGETEKPGHRAYDHHYHLKPNSDSGYDHLDEKGNIVREGSDASHLYNPENVWWD